MTLRSTIQDLRSHADVANDERQVKMRTGQFVELSARLSPALAELPRLKVGLAEVQQLDIALPVGRGQEAVQVVEALRALAADLPTVAIDQNLDLVKARVRSAEKYVSELRALVAGAWHTYVSQPLPAINSDLVDALALGGVDVDDIRNALELARGHLLAISNMTIPDRGAVDRFRAAIESIRRCGERLGEVVDQDIAEGIVRAQEQPGMPLSWFTPERLEKLEGLGIVDRFQVRLR